MGPLDLKYHNHINICKYKNIQQTERKEGNSIQLFHIFLCNSQNYHPRGAVDDPMALLHEASCNSAIGSSTAPRGDSFNCCTERYEIVVLLPSSELTKGINKRDADQGGWAL